MSETVIFGGTTEGRELSLWLAAHKVPHSLSVATGYAKRELDAGGSFKDGLVSVHSGRMDCPQMTAFIKDEGARIVVDATHPYAEEASVNIQNAAKDAGAEYLRLERKSGGCSADAVYFDSAAECAEALRKSGGNILLTTGSKTLGEFASYGDLKDRLVARVLPSQKSIDECEKFGITGANMIAMQGPFSKEMNLAVIKEYDIKTVVTKDGGAAGGFEEKAAAARETHCALYVIKRPEAGSGLSPSQVRARLREKLGIKERLKIFIIGCGMGAAAGMTLEGRHALKEAELVFGSQRLLDCPDAPREKYPYYKPSDIIPVIKEKKKNAAVLFSGDVGFSSGAAGFYEAVRAEMLSGAMEAEVRLSPGISSVQALAAAFKISWEDAKIINTHGRGGVSKWGASFLYCVRHCKKTFILPSDIDDLKAAAGLIVKAGMGSCRMLVGCRLSYADEELLEISPEEAGSLDIKGLCCAFVLNGEPEAETVAFRIPDGEFIRGSVPMTKEEVRTVSISKLELKAGSVVYDIGCGTGSVSVQIAAQSPSISVCAIDDKAEAVELANKNRAKFALMNMEVIAGTAPAALSDLPMATHAFIGGSGGKLFEILDALYKINPGMRVVVNAVSLESAGSFASIEAHYKVKDFEVTALQASRSHAAGSHHIMKSANQVWICSFEFDGI